MWETIITTVTTAITANPTSVLLYAILVIAMTAFIVAQCKKDGFDLRSIVLNDEGKVSLHKLGQLVALLISSWGFIYVVMHNALTEWFFFMYMVVWSGSTSLDNYIKLRMGASSQEAKKEENQQGS